MMRRTVTRTDVQTAVDDLYKLADRYDDEALQYELDGDFRSGAARRHAAHDIRTILATLEEQ